MAWKVVQKRGRTPTPIVRLDGSGPFSESTVTIPLGIILSLTPDSHLFPAHASPKPVIIH